MKKRSVILAAGCFWCIQKHFDEIDGVLSTTVGYTGGHTSHPTYEAVCGGSTGHYEALQVEFDEEKISFEEVIEAYLSQVDPENAYGQFCDLGSQYLLAVFYENEEEKQAIEKKVLEFQKEHHLKKMMIRVLLKETFYPAEVYHQKFYQKSPLRYHQYQSFSGRKERLKEIGDKKLNVDF